MKRLSTQLAALYALGAASALVALFLLLAAGLELPEPQYETGKYVNPALGWYEHGGHLRYGNGGMDNYVPGSGAFVPETTRLIGYPLLIAAVFKVAGLHDFTALAVVQALLYGIVVAGVGFGARAIRPGWMWPAAILAALWPNMLIRASILLPEPLFMACFVWGVAALLWALRSERYRSWLLVAGCGFGLALMVRPAAMLVPFAIFPILLWWFLTRGRGWLQALIAAALPLAMCVLIVIPQLLFIHKETGVWGLTTQNGAHALYHLYPCLATRWGCGQPDPELVKEVLRLEEERLAQLTPEQRANPGVVSKTQQKLAFGMIAELSPGLIFNAAMGSIIKMLMHNAAYELMLRFGGEAVYLSELPGGGLSEKAKSFVKAVAGNGWMMLWVIFFAALILSRLIQLAGIFLGLFRKGDEGSVLRGQTLLMLAISVAVVVLAVGTGNNRYRVPIEPILIYFTLMGVQPLLDYWRRRKGRAAGEA